MDKKIKALWAKNKLLFILLLIPIVLVFFGDSIIQLLVRNSGRIFKDAQETDSQLRSDQTAANTQANDLVHKADSADDNKPSVDEDWYKKK